MKNSDFNRLHISRWIKKWRTEHGLSQGAVAVGIGVNLNSVQSWERGYNHPKQENFDKLIAFIDKIERQPKEKLPKQRNW